MVGGKSFGTTGDVWGFVKDTLLLCPKKQLNFKLAEIDREKTKEAVEGALEKYCLYLLTVPDTEGKYLLLSNGVNGSEVKL